MKLEDEQIYLFLLGRTMVLSVVITISCILLGYPIAYILADPLPERRTCY